MSTRTVFPLVGSLVILLLARSVVPGADASSTRRSPSSEERLRLRPRTADLIPTGYRPAKETQLAKATFLGKEFWFYDRIESTSVTTPELPVRFCLIVDEFSGRPFYLMENKVWNGLFRKFDKEIPSTNTDREADQKWAEIASIFRDRAELKSDDKLPAFWVRYDRARQFANWLKGDLPTQEQWDLAAGWQVGKTTGGPFLNAKEGETLQICVGRPRPAFPWQVDECKHDISPVSGCRQMAGNGKEWTRRVSTAGNVALRGRYFGDETPLTYVEFSPQNFGVQDPTKTDQFVAFRVALEIK